MAHVKLPLPVIALGLAAMFSMATALIWQNCKPEVAQTLSAEEQTLAEMKEEPYKPRERITSDGVYDFRVAAINHRFDGFTSILFELKGHPEVPRVGNGSIWFKTSRKCTDLKVGQVYKMRYVTANSGTFPAFRSKVFGEKVVCL